MVVSLLSKHLRPLILSMAVFFLCESSSVAGSLQVSTTVLDVAAPGSATSLALRNLSSVPTNAQIRVLKWSQKDGVESLVETRDVVASPPFAAIAPGREYTVRVVRISRAPLRGEESYRLLIDELPDLRRGETLGVKFVVRYSLPVFFGAPLRSTSTVALQAEAGRGRIRLTAVNAGSKRIRLSGLNIQEQTGISIARKEGLVGYVLGRSSMSWTFPVSKRQNFSRHALVSINSDSGPIHARIPLSTLP